MNTTWKCALVISGNKVYIAWKQKMFLDVVLHDTIGGHQAYIRSKKDKNLKNPILQLAKTIHGSHTSHDEIIYSLR